MLAEGRVGQVLLGDGTPAPNRMGRYGGQATMDAHSRYYDCVTRGNVYMAAQQAAAALGTALTATAVTLTLYNPLGSSKNFVLMQATLAVPVGTTAGQVVYAVNNAVGQAAPTATTALASGIQGCLLGAGNKSVAAVYSAATLPAAPVAIRTLAGIISTTPGGVHSIIDNLDGALILTPGSMVTIQGITTNATGQISLMWEEVTP